MLAAYIVKHGYWALLLLLLLLWFCRSPSLWCAGFWRFSAAVCILDFLAPNIVFWTLMMNDNIVDSTNTSWTIYGSQDSWYHDHQRSWRFRHICWTVKSKHHEAIDSSSRMLTNYQSSTTCQKPQQEIIHTWITIIKPPLNPADRHYHFHIHHEAESRVHMERRGMLKNAFTTPSVTHIPPHNYLPRNHQAVR